MRLFLTGLVLLLIGLEVGARCYKGRLFSSENFVETDIRYLGNWYPTSPDSELGWVIDIRSSGEKRKAASLKGAYLAVGDSFTYGSQVDDEETWPAHLEELTGVPVLNAGVPGYGVDQSYLRAMRLLPIVKPTGILFSLIPNDIVRAEHELWNGASKPFFAFADGRLNLQNVPVTPPDKRSFRLTKAHNALGHSLFIHALLKRLYPQVWFASVKPEWTHKRATHDGVPVSCRLLKKLSVETTLRRKLFLVVVQYAKATSAEELLLAEQLVHCLRKEKVPFLDLHPILVSLQNFSPDYYEKLFANHMTSQGNAWIARAISDRLKQPAIAPHS